MALSEDQRALVRLLLAGDTYERVGDVLGTSPDDVRSRAHAAAAVLADERNEEFTARALNARLAALDGAPAAAPTAPPPASAGRSWALWIAGGGALAVLIIVVVLVARGGGGDEGDGGSPAPDREDVVPVRMTPVGGSGGSGTIAIVRAGDQPALDLAIRGLEPSRSGETYVLWLVGSGDRSLPVAFQAVRRAAQAGTLPQPVGAEVMRGALR